MYIREILLYLTLPAVVIISYFAVRWALKKFEKNLSKNE